MQKTAYHFIFFTLCIIFAIPLFAADEDWEKPVSPGPGMVMKQIGSFTVLVPEDAQVKVDDKGRIYVEKTEEYITRKFKDMDARVKKLETQQTEFKKRIKYLERAIAHLRKKAEARPKAELASE